MREKFKQQASSGESWIDAYDRRRAELFQEFNPRFTDLNTRIIAYLLEHGADNSDVLKNFEKESDDLVEQLNDRVKQKNASSGQQVNLDLWHLEQYGAIQQRNRMIKEVHRIMKQKPTIEDLRQKVAELKKEAQPWKRLQEEVKRSGRAYLLNPISSAVYDKELETFNFAGLLEEKIKEMKYANKDFTKEDLEEAKKDLEEASEIGMRGNNPNAGRAERQAAARKLRIVEQALKQSGMIEKTPGERLTEELDQLHPNAKSKTVVEHQGKKYQIQYFPLESSRTGKTVFEWGHQWVPFLGEQAPKSKKQSPKNNL